MFKNNFAFKSAYNYGKISINNKVIIDTNQVTY